MSSFVSAFASTLAHILPRRPRARTTLPWALFVAPLLDEWTTGFLVVALPQLRNAVGLSYEQIGLLFTFGALTSLVFDPVLNFVSDLFPKRLPMLLGMVVLAGCYVLAGFAGTFAALAVAFALLWPAVSTAVDLAQLMLIDRRPSASGHTMARWTLLSGVGDLLAPLTVAAFLGLRLGWTALCLLAGALWLGAALLNWLGYPRSIPATTPATVEAVETRSLEDADEGEKDDENEEAERSGKLSLLAVLRGALGNRLLLRWIVVGTMASMLDEIFLGFAGLDLSDVRHVPVGLVSLALLANLVGGMLGLVLLERALGRFGQRAGPRLLPWYAVVALIGMAGFLLAPGVPLAVGALFLVGLGASGWYPVAMAAAFDTQPGRPGLVRAVATLGAPFETVLPGIVGFLAGRFGLPVGIAFLGLAPVVVLLTLPRRQGSGALAPKA